MRPSGVSTQHLAAQRPGNISGCRISPAKQLEFNKVCDSAKGCSMLLCDIWPYRES